MLLSIFITHHKLNAIAQHASVTCVPSRAIERIGQLGGVARETVEAKMASLDMPAVITHIEELIVMFSSDPELIAGALFSTNFIQDDVLLKMSSEDTPTGKAAILFEAVTKEIEMAPEKLTEFHEIISENAIDIADGLLSTYQGEFSLFFK